MTRARKSTPKSRCTKPARGAAVDPAQQDAAQRPDFKAPSASTPTQPQPHRNAIPLPPTRNILRSPATTASSAILVPQNLKLSRDGFSASTFPQISLLRANRRPSHTLSDSTDSFLPIFNLHPNVDSAPPGRPISVANPTLSPPPSLARSPTTPGTPLKSLSSPNTSKATAGNTSHPAGRLRGLQSQNGNVTAQGQRSHRKSLPSVRYQSSTGSACPIIAEPDDASPHFPLLSALSAILCAALLVLAFCFYDDDVHFTFHNK